MIANRPTKDGMEEYRDNVLEGLAVASFPFLLALFIISIPFALLGMTVKWLKSDWREGQEAVE